MRFLILFSLVLTVVYSNNLTFENLDVDKFLSNEKLRKSVFACLMDQGPCEGVQGLKDTIPQLLRTKCSQCNPKQKEKFDYFSNAVLEKFPEKLNALMSKYSTAAN